MEVAGIHGAGSLVIGQRGLAVHEVQAGTAGIGVVDSGVEGGGSVGVGLRVPAFAGGVDKEDAQAVPLRQLGKAAVLGGLQGRLGREGLVAEDHHDGGQREEVAHPVALRHVHIAGPVRHGDLVDPGGVVAHHLSGHGIVGGGVRRGLIDGDGAVGVPGEALHILPHGPGVVVGHGVGPVLVDGQPGIDVAVGALEGVNDHLLVAARLVEDVVGAEFIGVGQGAVGGLAPLIGLVVAVVADFIELPDVLEGRLGHSAGAQLHGGKAAGNVEHRQDAAVLGRGLQSVGAAEQAQRVGHDTGKPLPVVQADLPGLVGAHGEAAHKEPALVDVGTLSQNLVQEFHDLVGGEGGVLIHADDDEAVLLAHQGPLGPGQHGLGLAADAVEPHKERHGIGLGQIQIVGNVLVVFNGAAGADGLGAIDLDDAVLLILGELPELALGVVVAVHDLVVELHHQFGLEALHGAVIDDLADARAHIVGLGHGLGVGGAVDDGHGDDVAAGVLGQGAGGEERHAGGGAGQTGEPLLGIVGVIGVVLQVMGGDVVRALAQAVELQAVEGTGIHGPSAVIIGQRGLAVHKVQAGPAGIGVVNTGIELRGGIGVGLGIPALLGVGKENAQAVPLRQRGETALPDCLRGGLRGELSIAEDHHHGGQGQEIAHPVALGHIHIAGPARHGDLIDPGGVVAHHTGRGVHGPAGRRRPQAPGIAGHEHRGSQ